MKLQTMISIALVAFAMTACKGSNGGGGGGEYAAPPPMSTFDVAWDRGYAEVQQTSRPSKTYELLDYTRSLLFDGHASVPQTQQRLALILQNSRAVVVSTERLNRFVINATDSSGYYKNRTSKQLLTGYRRR